MFDHDSDRRCNQDHRSRREIGREWLDDRATTEGEFRRSAEGRDLVRRRLNHRLLATGSVEIGLRRVEAILADP